MTTKIAMVALMLCTCYIASAQVEQEVRQIAENEHKRFASELPNALAKGQTSILGYAKAEKNQFFLEDNVNTFTEILGWTVRGYNQKTITSVFVALSDKSKPGLKNANPVTVNIDFPVVPSECIISIKKDSKGKLANYVVTTKADVTVEVTRENVQPSIAKNTVALKWEGKVPLINGEVDYRKKIASPVLRSIKITPITGFSETKVKQMQNMAKSLIEEYYANLQSPAKHSTVLAPEIPNQAELEQWLRNNTKIEIGSGSVNVPLPTESQIIEVKNVPDVFIHVDATPYMVEDPSQYSNAEAYHQLALTFTVDLKAEKITKVVYKDNFVRKLDIKPVLVDKSVEITTVVTQPKTQPVPESIKPASQQAASQQAQPTGMYFKIQILHLDTYKSLAELPQRFRVANISVEKYSDGYKYVVPAGKTMKEASAMQKKLYERGLVETWIVLYQNGERIQPFAGKPELILEK